MNIGIIAAIIILAILALIIWACIGNKCIGCGEPAVMCKSCKHYDPPLVASNYEPKEEEDEMMEVDFLAQRINALDDDEFFQLSKLVTRGYEDGRD